ncbi:MAG TPA: hypothetical protein VGR37_24415 [Longimicrobiaceae bacterium]|nr:hypothetical protein [Longimicrobiaceae bacterium]
MWTLLPTRWLRRIRTLLAAGAIVLASGVDAVASQAPKGGDMAVIAHPGSGVRDVSLDRLRATFLGEQQFWPGGSRVTLLVLPPGSQSREVMLREVYRMNEAAFRRYWIAKIFRAEVSSGPKMVDGTATALRLVPLIPGAVAIIPASAVDGKVTVLRVDGRLPGESGYPLR